MPNVVTVNVSIQNPPTPSKLQKTGAFVSMGGTSLPPGQFKLLLSRNDILSVLAGTAPAASLTQTAGLATFTAVANHGIPIGETALALIAGAAGVSGSANYNGLKTVTATTATAFTYAVPSGTGTPPTGTIVYTLEDVGELAAMNNTFFNQGANQGVYVLELGAGDVDDAVAFLGNWIASTSPQMFYSYLVPRTWDGNASYLGLLAGFEFNTASTYFFTTMSLTTAQNGTYSPAMKCLVPLVESPKFGVYPANQLTGLSWANGVGTATTTTNHGVTAGTWFNLTSNAPTGWNGYFLALPGTAANSLVFAVPNNPGAETNLGNLVAGQTATPGIPSNEFSAAAEFYVTLNYAPASFNRVPALNLAMVFGVTPFPSVYPYGELADQLNAGGVSTIATGAFGGLPSALLVSGGFTYDKNPFNYWYSVDWACINLALNVNNAVINGSNNKVNPLYLNQDGINRVQAVAGATLKNGVSYGLFLGSVVEAELTPDLLTNALNDGTFNGNVLINADPFPSYYTDNPDDYAIGVYGGYVVQLTPLRGFASIVFNIIVTNFVAPLA